MIRLFLWFLLALVIGGVAAAWIGDDKGYILINFSGYAVETSVVAMVLLLLIGFSIFYLLLWLASRLNPLRMVRNRGGIFLSRGQATAGTESGMVLLSEGRYRDAYKLLLETARQSPLPLVNYLGAAEAAFRTDDLAGVRYCLREAEKYSPAASVANGLFTARIEMKTGRIEEASVQLKSLQIHHPKHSGILTLLSDVYVKVGAWAELTALVPVLRKQEVMSDAACTALELQAWRGRLQLFNAGTGQMPELERLWESVPAHIKNDEATLGTYLHKLVEMGSYDRAQGMLIRYFKKGWSDTLIRMLGYLDTSEPAQLLVFLEKLAREHPNHALLALTTGRVCMRNHLWGKGRDCLESGLRFSSDEKLKAEINAELARLYGALGESEKSVVCYQRALHLLDHRLPDLPLP